MTELVRRRPLVSFVVLAYLGSWIGWGPWWLSRNGVGLLPYELPMSAIAAINQLGLFLGPFTAALVVTGLTGGRHGIGQLLRRLLAGRVHPGWYVLVLLAVPVAAGAGYVLLGGVHPTTSGTALVVTLLVTGVVYLFGGPLQEEPGWRGVALPLLQERRHPLAAAGILGVIHTCWHLPLALTREWDPSLAAPGQPVAYLVMVLGDGLPAVVGR